MLNEIILLIAILVAIFFIVFGKSETKYIDVKIGNETVHSEVADTWPKRIRGLMFRDSLPKNEGMFFIFDSDEKYGFWMMNMSFPIDIIWIDSGKRIVYFVEDAQSCKIFCQTYSPDKEARYVLEVNSGFVQQHDIEIGQKVEFKE